MPLQDPDRIVHPLVSRRRFLKHAGVGAAGMAAVLSGAGRARVFAASPYPDWIPAVTKPPKRGGTHDTPPYSTDLYSSTPG